MPTDADLISIIRTHLALIKCKLRQCWIKGHQDSSATRKLSATSRQDSVASGYRTSGHMQSRPGCEHVHSQCCSISINHQRLSGQFDECTRYHVNGYHLLRHLQDKTLVRQSVGQDTPKQPPPERGGVAIPAPTGGTSIGIAGCGGATGTVRNGANL